MLPGEVRAELRQVRERRERAALLADDQGRLVAESRSSVASLDGPAREDERRAPSVSADREHDDRAPIAANSRARRLGLRLTPAGPCSRRRGPCGSPPDGRACAGAARRARRRCASRRGRRIPQTRSSSRSRERTMPGVLEEAGEQVELLGRQLDGVAVDRDVVRRRGGARSRPQPSTSSARRAARSGAGSP